MNCTVLWPSHLPPLWESARLALSHEAGFIHQKAVFELPQLVRISSLRLQHQLIRLLGNPDHEPVVDCQEVPVLGHLGSNRQLSSLHFTSLRAEATMHLNEVSKDLKVIFQLT